MRYVLLSEKRNQFRANLHCHSILSDGSMTPEELRNAYRDHGYSILAITDHERPKDHSSLTTENFLMLTGYECYIRTTPNGVMDPYAPEVHLNLFAKDPHNETFICYDPNYGKYIRKYPDEFAAMRRAGSERPREYTVEYVNEYIQTAVDNGYLVSYNHPAWSLEEESTILAYENCFGLEVHNFGSHRSGRLENNGVLYNRMLSRGRKVFCLGGDDNHNRAGLTDSFGAWTMILADSLTYEDVIAAMERGDLYASSGPTIKEISIEGNSVRVSCSPATQISLYNGSKKIPRAVPPKGDTLEQAEFALDDRAQFFRIAVFDAQGGSAMSRGYFREEFTEG